MDSEIFSLPRPPLKVDLSKLNPPQEEAVTHRQGPLLILAGAGSGKTRAITYRIAYLLERGTKPWNILAVTFTNKAAEEMKERVLRLTSGYGRGVWISTFHSFCAQFLRIESSAIGIERDFPIYDEDDQKKVVKECLRELNLDDKKFKPGSIAAAISRNCWGLMSSCIQRPEEATDGRPPTAVGRLWNAMVAAN